VIIGTICARGGSKGVPRKALRELGGIPLLGHAVLCARGASRLDRVVCSTDDAAIAETAVRFGAEVPFLRPAGLAEDRSPKWEVFRHLVREYEKSAGGEVSALADLDVSVPLRRSATVDAAVALLAESGADVVVTAYRTDANPYYNVVELAVDGAASIVKPVERAVQDRQSAPAVYRLSPAVFAIRAKALWEYDHWSRARMRIVELDREEGWDIDGPLDLEIVRLLFERRAGTPVSAGRLTEGRP
jgi:CMP-N-acetylneuraminic acid synthetase